MKINIPLKNFDHPKNKFLLINMKIAQRIEKLKITKIKKYINLQYTVFTGFKKFICDVM